MEIIRRRAFARAGLFGNPSDGFGGKTIAFVVRDFWAEAVLYEWDQLEIVSLVDDRSAFRSLDELTHDVDLHGYYGGIRLVKASIKRFAEYCRGKGLPLHDRTFAIRYQTNIPRSVGLAGSSAIITACLRALSAFYGVAIEPRVQPSLALSVETDELAIPGGLQDRVVQAYEGLVHMDFAQEAGATIDGMFCGAYEPLDASLLQNVYVAYDAEAGQPTDVVHTPLRQRYEAGDAAVVSVMQRLAALTDEARGALAAGRGEELRRLCDENFDLRRSICTLAPRQRAMVSAARAAGATAKFAGSGGAIVGFFPDDAGFDRLRQSLSAMGCRTLRPQIQE